MEQTETKTETKIKPTKTAREVELERQLAQAKKDLALAEDTALEKVARAVGVDPETLTTAPAPTKPEEYLNYDLGDEEVSINGRSYRGRGKEKASIVEVLVSMAGNARMRRLNEMIGRNYAAGRMIEGRIVSWKEVKADTTA